MINKRPVGRPRRPVAADAVRELRKAGLSFRQIARKLGFGYGSIRRAYYGAYSNEEHPCSRVATAGISSEQSLPNR